MRRFFLFSGILLFVLSCKEEVIYNTDQFEGYWDLAEAKRDGKITNTLRGAFLKVQNGQMKDNMFTQEVGYPFSLDGADLIHHADPERRYKVVSLERDTLVVKTNHLKYKFEFRFERTKR